MYSTSDLQLFIRIVDTGSLSKAARDLHLSSATASAGLKRLERQLGVLLFARSTRSMRLTPEGDIFLEYCRSALALLRQGEALLAMDKNSMRGHVRLSAPSDLGRRVLLPWFNAFQERHPDVTLALQFSDRVSDLMRDPVDVALRYGRLEDSSLVSQQLVDNRRVVVASPAYLARHGTPKTPKDLTHHNCLLYYLKPGLLNTWRFGTGKDATEVKVRGDRTADDGGIVREWAVAGAGIAYKSWLDVQQDVRDGRLVTVLNGFAGEQSPLNALYPHRGGVSPVLRALISFLREKLEALQFIA